MRRLSHPNIVRLHGVTKEGPLYNIFVEWCAGECVQRVRLKMFLFIHTKAKFCLMEEYNSVSLHYAMNFGRFLGI